MYPLLHCLNKSKLAHLLRVALMQTTWMHFKQQVRQPRSTAMNNKGSVHLAIIGHSVTLDEILEAYNVGNSLLAVPDWILVAWNLTFLGDPQTTAIARHGECISCLRDLRREFLVAT